MNRIEELRTEKGWTQQQLADADFDGIETDYDANEVRLGLRFSF